MASAVGRRGRGGFVAARIGKAHGIRGEVTVALHTDSPQERFAPGTRFDLEPGAGGVSSGAPGTPSGRAWRVASQAASWPPAECPITTR